MCLAPCSIVLVVLRTRSYRTLRDGSFAWRFSRHFVPGYDRTVPPGQFATGFSYMLWCWFKMSASGSRRDDTDRSLARSAWETVPRKNRPVGYGMIGYEGQQREGLGQDANRSWCQKVGQMSRVLLVRPLVGLRSKTSLTRYQGLPSVSPKNVFSPEEGAPSLES